MDPDPEADREFNMVYENAYTSPYEESEYCLYLNVFAPAGKAQERDGRLVMF